MGGGAHRGALACRTRLVHTPREGTRHVEGVTCCEGQVMGDGVLVRPRPLLQPSTLDPRPLGVRHQAAIVAGAIPHLLIIPPDYER